MPPAEPLVMVLWIIAAALVVILLLVLRNTAQLSRLARHQQRLADKLATAPPPRRHEPPAEPHLAAAPSPKPAPPLAAAAAAPIEPITVRTDPDLGVVYSFRGKDYLSRIAADQARWRALNQADGTAHARAETIDGPVQRGHG